MEENLPTYMNLQVKYTKDGSVTLLNTMLNVTYHSRYGAMLESRHIYINNGLKHAALIFGNNLNVLEMGFGTGLNAWLSLEEALKSGLSLQYTGIEKYPVPDELLPALNYAQTPEEQERFAAIWQCPWEQKVNISGSFSLYKQKTDIRDVVFPERLQVVYYDAFDPDTSPESWEQSIFERLLQAMLPGACLLTFCAKGQIRRLLKETGFIVEALPGPPGKREITRAIKSSS